MDTKRKVMFCSFRRISDEYSCPEIVEATVVDPERLSTFTARTVSWDVPAVIDYLNEAGSGCDETVLLVDQHACMDWVLHQLVTKCNNLRVAAFHEEAKGKFCPQLQIVPLEKFADTRALVKPIVSWKEDHEQEHEHDQEQEQEPRTPRDAVPAIIPLGDTPSASIKTQQQPKCVK